MDNMNYPAYCRKLRVLHELEAYGFKDGKYGDVPFELVDVGMSIEDTDFSARYNIVADRRGMGWVIVHIDGELQVHLDMANWMNPKPITFWSSTKPVKISTFPIRTDVKVPYQDFHVKHYSAYTRAGEKPLDIDLEKLEAEWKAL